MPLIVRDFTWEQTDKAIFVTVPLKGVKVNKVSVISSEEYVKVSFPPYLFECLLYSPVEDTSSVAQVGNGTVLFKLLKKEQDTWPQLHSDDSTNKEVMKEKREAAVNISQERAKEAEKEKAETKRLNEKFAINEVMKMEEAERQRIENIKETERNNATEDLERWKEEQRQLAQMEKERLLEERMSLELAKKEEHKKQRKRNKKNNIFEETAEGIPTREVGKIEVNFTPRVFPTPVRESQTHQEDEWLKKQAESRKLVEIEDADLTEEEKNPVFLRDKGNSFFKTGNYQAAINAYTHAMRLSPGMPALYSNRAACHLKLRNLFKCIEDCSKAMDILTPPVPQNAASRCKALVRRGTAFCELELYVEGLQDYEAALKIDPNNEQIKQDAENIRHIIQTSSDYT